MKNAVKVFLISFGIFALAVGITLFQTKGVWIYYGDFNVQQIPFYIHLHDLIRSGNLCYDFSTDLGGSVIGDYSFYILGSPFFWLTIPFPSNAVVYLLPWINALKYAVMGLSSYLYLRRHTKTSEGAAIGALLYTFSGYSGAVLVYNHFHDVLAFFPFYLILFENMVEKKKRLGFILMTGFMAIVNYFFFFGEAVFLIIYFCVRYLDIKACYVGENEEQKGMTKVVKRLWRALWCAILGVVSAAWFLYPAIRETLGNSRLKDTVNGYDFVTYKESTLPLGILKNTVLLSDISGLNSMFNPSMSRVSGIGAYLPLFSVAGVIAYFLIYKKNCDSKEMLWPRRLLTVSLVFAFVPFLNSLFSAMNSEYYARWYFMPILIMSLVTARVLETVPTEEYKKKPLIKGSIFVAATVVFFTICAILPAKTEEDEATILGALKAPEELICELTFSGLMAIALMFFTVFLFPKIKKMKSLLWITIAASFLTCATMMMEGFFTVEKERKLSYIEQGIRGKDKVELPNEDIFCRIETEEDVYNYPMIWNRPTATAFISTVPSSVIDFYKGIGVGRKVTSKLGVTRMGARSLLCCRYYLVEKEIPIEHIGHVEDTETLSSFTKLGETNGFDIYENNYFVPMGICFDECISEENYKENEQSSATMDRLLMKAVILDEDALEKYGYLFEELDPETMNAISLNGLSTECEKRRETAALSFETTKNGFTAKVDMAKENLMLFSVPYDENFRAYIDGTETEIVKVDFGLMAVLIPEGIHEVEFKYFVWNLKK